MTERESQYPFEKKYGLLFKKIQVYLTVLYFDIIHQSG